MIRRNIQNGRNIRAEPVHRFQLKAADFRHRDRSFCGFCHQTGIGNPNISHHLHIQSRMPHNLSQQGSSCGFPVGSGYCKDPALLKHGGKLNFAPDCKTRLFHPLHIRNIQRHPGTQYGNVAVQNHMCRQTAGIDFSLFQ